MADEQEATKTEYQHLLSHFERLLKITGTFISAILLIGGFFFYKNVSDISSEAKKAVDATKDSAAAQISHIKDDAAAVAKAEAQKRVDEAFNAQNVSDLVEAAARKKVGKVIERQVQEEVQRSLEDLESEVRESGEVASLEGRIRLGNRKAFEELRRKAVDARHESARAYARNMISIIAEDYDRHWQENVRGADPFSIVEGFGETGQPIKTARDLVSFVKRSQNLNAIAAAFIGLRQVTKHEFHMFDFAGLDQWCSDHKGQCE